MRRDALPTALILAALLLAPPGEATAQPPVMAQTITGARSPAILASRPGSLSLTYADGHPLPLEQLVRWGAPPLLGDRPLLLLADGSLICGQLATIETDRLRLESASAGDQWFSRPAVRAAVLQLPADRLQRERLLDRLLRRGPDNPPGVLLASGDRLSGEVEAPSGEAIKLRSAGRDRMLPLTHVSAVIFPTAEAPPAAARAVWIGLDDGSRLRCLSAQMADQQVECSLGTGKLRVPARQVVWLQPVGGAAVYLSDLPVAEYRHLPYLGLAWPYRLDRGLEGGWLACGGQQYMKGLAVHSAARLTYALAEPYRAFEAELGIDHRMGDGGSVRFRVFVDGKLRYTSTTVRGGQPPLPMRVELADAKRLDLVVDYADRADQQDHALWLDARLIR